MDYVKLNQIKNIGYYLKDYIIYTREGLFPVLDLTITQDKKYKSCIDWVYFVKIYDDSGYEINIIFKLTNLLIISLLFYGMWPI